MPNILVIGHGRHGKDTFADYLSEALGVTSCSSSMCCAEEAVYPLTRDIYSSVEECYNDRANHRALWFHAIAAYNERPGMTLAEQMLSKHSIYTGMRKRVEYDRSRHLFDHIIWVERPGYPKEPATSMELSIEDATEVVYNDSTLDALKDVAVSVSDYIKEFADE